jgi:ketosteroid isomerase-like protein
MRQFLSLAMLIAASFMISCGDGSTTSTNSAANKPSAGTNNSTSTAPAANAATVEADVKKAVNDVGALLAKNDAAGLEKFYADNYMLVNPDGGVQTRADRLASLRSGDTKFDTFAYDEINVRPNPEGTAAVVIAKVTATGTNRGRKIEGPLRVTQVWVKGKDGWQQVSAQATPILGSATSAAANTAAANSASATRPATNGANANTNR